MSLSGDNFKVEKSGSVATLTYNDESAFFEESALTKKQIKEVFDHTHQYIESAVSVAADVSTTTMKKDKTIDKVIISLPYGMSKRGGLDITAKRSTTFRGIGDNPDVTRSDLRLVVKDPLTKMSKTKLKELQAKMTATLLD